MPRESDAGGRRRVIRPARHRHNGPPITRRPRLSIPSPAAPGYGVRKKAQQSEGSRILYCIVLDEQTFCPFELEARFARPMVIFDPRHALIPQVSFWHDALHGSRVLRMRPGGGASITVPWSRTIVSCFTHQRLISRIEEKSWKPTRARMMPRHGSDAERVTERVGVALPTKRRIGQSDLDRGSRAPGGFIDLDHTAACGLGVSIPNGGTCRHAAPQDCALSSLSARGRGRGARRGICATAWGRRG
jgi:hypothetical protein